MEELSWVILLDSLKDIYGNLDGSIDEISLVQSDRGVLGYLDGSADELIPGLYEGTNLGSSVEFSERYIHGNIDNSLKLFSL